MITHIQGSGNSDISASSSITVTLSSTSVNNTLVVFAVGLSTFLNSPIFSISDSNGNVWSTDADIQVSYSRFLNISVYLFHAPITTGGNVTITVNSTITALMSISVDEYSSGFPLVLFSSQIGSATGSAISLSGASANIGDLAVAGFNVQTTGLTYTAGTGYTLGYTQNGVSNQPMLTEYDVSYSSTSLSATATLSSAAQWAGIVADYKENVPTLIYESDQATSQEQAPLSLFKQIDPASSLDSNSLLLLSLLDISTNINPESSMTGFVFSDLLSELDQVLLLVIESGDIQVSESDNLILSMVVLDSSSSFDSFYQSSIIYSLESFSSQDAGLLSLQSVDSGQSIDSQFLSLILFFIDMGSSLDTQLPFSSMFFADSALEGEASYQSILPVYIYETNPTTASDMQMLEMQFTDQAGEAEVYNQSNLMYQVDTATEIEF